MRHLGRGDEIAALTELRRARDVVAKPRRIQRMVHKLGKRNAATGLVDMLPDVLRNALALLEARRVGLGQ